VTVEAEEVGNLLALEVDDSEELASGHRKGCRPTRWDDLVGDDKVRIERRLLVSEHL
jgi:hypothetical protein